MNNALFFGFGQAFELTKLGKAVSCVDWDLVERVTTVAETKYVEAAQIWSPENRRMGTLLKGPQGAIPVRPYSTKFTREGIENYIPTNQDMNSVWMHSDCFAHCSIFDLDETGEYDVIRFKTELMGKRNHLTENLPFWMLYDQDMIGYHHKAVFIASNRSSNLVNSTIFNVLSEMANKRNNSDQSEIFEADLDFLNDGWNGFCDGQQKHYLHVNLDEFDYDIDHWFTNITEPTNVFIDTDSLNEMNLANGENALEYIRGRCSKLAQDNVLINWVAFSLKEEMGNSKVAGDETFALKAE